MKLFILMLKWIFILSVFFNPLSVFAQQNSLAYQISFEKNKYKLSTKNKQLLSLICDTLVNKTNYKIHINGHTDSDADISYNQQLSMRRSLAVKTFLIEKGIDESIMSVQYMGEEQPLIANTTPLEKAKNRRVELFVLFPQKTDERIIEIKNKKNTPVCLADTTVTLDGGYTITLSKCDWDKNKKCLKVEKRLTYKYIIKENWLKKHLGFKNYKKTINYEPHYEFRVVACFDSCFSKSIKLYIPHYQAPELQTGISFSQKKNDKGISTALIFKKTKLGKNAYYVADISCPGSMKCGFDSRCDHPINLYAKKNISLISYSYYQRRNGSFFDTTIEAKPLSAKKLTDDYTHSIFQSLNLLYKGDTVTLKNIPIDFFAHGLRKIKTKTNVKSYFLFIPYRKRKCEHFKKYKIRAKDLEYLKRFNLIGIKTILNEE